MKREFAIAVTRQIKVLCEQGERLDDVLGDGAGELLRNIASDLETAIIDAFGFPEEDLKNDDGYCRDYLHHLFATSSTPEKIIRSLEEELKSSQSP